MTSWLPAAASIAGAYALALAAVSAYDVDRVYPGWVAVGAAVAGLALLFPGLTRLWGGARRAVVGVAGCAALAVTIVAWVGTPAAFAMRIPIIDRLAYFLLGGFDAVASTGGGVVIETADFIVSLQATVANTGMIFWLTFLGLAFLVLVGCRRVSEKGRVAATFLAWWFGAVVLSYAGIAAVRALDKDVLSRGTSGLSALGDARWVACAGIVGMIGMASTLGKGLRGPVRVGPTPESWRLRDRRWPGVVLLVCSLSVLVWRPEAITRDVVPREPRRILIDDYHSGEWERSSRTFDERHYGDSALYNYAGLSAWLAHDHYVTVHSDGPWTAALLDQHDVVLIKTPALALSSDESAALESWITDGGSAVLLGDHTNLFGMNHKLNRICAKHGIHFRDDGVNDYRGGLARHHADWRFARGHWMGVGETEFMTSCSLGVSGAAEERLVLPHCLSDRPDYGETSFFGDFQVDGQDRVGPACVAARVRVGEGRIVCFADSTLFSNFTLGEPGHDLIWQALLADALDETVPDWPAALGVLCLLGAGWFLLVTGVRRTGLPGLAACASLCAVGCALGIALVGVVESSRSPQYRQQLLKTDAPRLYIPTRNMMFWLLPAIGPRDEQYAPFAVSTLQTVALRAGRIPSFVVDGSLPELASKDAVVLVNPQVNAESDRLLRNLMRRVLAAGAEVYVVWPEATISAMGTMSSEFVAELRRMGLGWERVRETGAGRATDAPVWLIALEQVSDAALGHCFNVPGGETETRLHALAAIFRPRG